MSPLLGHPSHQNLKPCDFSLWGYLKGTIYSDNLTDLRELKDAINRHDCTIHPDILRTTFENAVIHFTLLLKIVDSTLNILCNTFQKRLKAFKSDGLTINFCDLLLITTMI